MRLSHFLVFAAVVLVALGCLRLLAGERIDGPKARALVADGALLLDVRTPEEYRGEHLPDARNIPISDLAARLREAEPKDRPVVVYCASGMRSSRARKLLLSNGWKEVYNLGGISRWGAK